MTGKKIESTTSPDMNRTDRFDIGNATLIFEARAVCFKIKSFMQKHAQNDGASVKETKQFRHVVLECDCIHRNPYEVNTRLHEALGFKCRPDNANYQAIVYNTGMLVEQKRGGGYSTGRLPNFLGEI